MRKYNELHNGQILYTANEEEFWEHGKDSNKPDGVLQKHTKIIVEYDDTPEVFFKVLEGEFEGKVFMWGWGDSNAKPEDLLTEEEYAQLVNKTPAWRIELSKVKQCPQRQDSLAEQMMELREIANRFGFYDAADYIGGMFEKK